MNGHKKQNLIHCRCKSFTVKLEVTKPIKAALSPTDYVENVVCKFNLLNCNQSDRDSWGE